MDERNDHLRYTRFQQQGGGVDKRQHDDPPSAGYFWQPPPSEQEGSAALPLTAKERSIFQAMVEESTIMVIADRQGRIEYVNDNLCRIAQYSRQVVTGQDYRILISIHQSNTPIHSIWATLSEGKAWNGEIKSLSRDGTAYWIQVTVLPFLDESGRPYRYLATGFDITKKKEAELQERGAAKIRESVLAGIDAIFNKDADLPALLTDTLQLLSNLEHVQQVQIWLINPHQTGAGIATRCFKPADTTSQTPGQWQYFELKNSKGLVALTWERQALQYQTYGKEQTSNDNETWGEQTNVKSAYGVPLGDTLRMVGVLTLGFNSANAPENISTDSWNHVGKHIGGLINRRRLEEEGDRIFNTAPNIACLLAADGLFTKVNATMCHLLEYPAEQLLSQPIEIFIHPDDLQKHQLSMQEFKQGAALTIYLEERCRTRSGKTMWVAWTVTKSFDGGLLCVGKDLSEAKNLESLLEKTNKLASIGAWEVNVVSGSVYWSKETRAIHEAEENYNPDFDSATMFFKEGADRERLVQKFMDCIATGTLIDEQAQIITSKGQERWVRVIGEAEMLAGVCQRIYGSFQDITEQKLKSIKLEESERRYANLFQLSPQPMWVYDMETLAFVDVNDAAVRHYGFAKEEFLAMTIKDIRPQEDVRVLEEAIKHSQDRIYSSYTYPFRHQTKNGDQIFVDVQSASVLYKGRTAKIVLATDVTEMLKYIAEIHDQNQRLKEISWIQSHVVRAPVARLMALVDLINNFDNSDVERGELIDGIRQSAFELDTIIRDISEKSRPVNR